MTAPCNDKRALMIGCMISSTFLTLIVIPAIFGLVKLLPAAAGQPMQAEFSARTGKTNKER